MTEERIGFKERETIDMKIYGTPKEVAVWFKRWCDERGLRFNQGMSLIKEIVHKKDEIDDMKTLISENRALIEELVNLQEIKDSPQIVEERKRPKTYGSKES